MSFVHRLMTATRNQKLHLNLFSLMNLKMKNRVEFKLHQRNFSNLVVVWNIWNFSRNILKSSCDCCHKHFKWLINIKHDTWTSCKIKVLRQFNWKRVILYVWLSSEVSCIWSAMPTKAESKDSKMSAFWQQLMRHQAWAFLKHSLMLW